MSDNEQKLKDLNSLKERLEADVRRSRMQDSFGLTKNSPLIRNLERVNKDIKEITESK